MNDSPLDEYSYQYLGVTLTKDGKIETEINIRMLKEISELVRHSMEESKHINTVKHTTVQITNIVCTTL